MSVAVIAYAAFYLTACLRNPEYYEAIEKWGEIIDDGLVLTFNANLHNFDTNTDIFVSVRFWPFLALTGLWVYFISRLQLHRGIGTFVIMMRMAAYEFSKLVLFWAASLALFASVTVIWFGD